DEAGDVEVGADRLAGLADTVRLVGLEAVQGEAVFVRVDGDGADAEFVRAAEDADGDLAAVSNEQFADRRGGRVRHGLSTDGGSKQVPGIVGTGQRSGSAAP